MSGFDQLHPSIQHHIVNTMGWPALRPLQDYAVGPLLAGHHALLLAPTAGGKTEAATFPILSRIAAQEWRPLSVLYLAPLRALLNNLLPRLERYCGFTGHRAALWHGDTPAGVRNRIMVDPPDVLLTTPESLEAMLISRRVNERWLFPNLRTVIVDEVHAFAAADRGWHLLAVLERLSRIAGRELQRVGLSATVGNPDELLARLTATCHGPRQVINPAAETIAEPEVTLDHVGSLDNAATVISRLHRGEKRLVFVDSRRRVEELANGLRTREVATFVSHGSLGRDERRRAEEAFAEANDCVIVATSTLELGIDVGDLDRVIQLDSPPSVAGFLQRIGRTGRRAGSSRNALFLACSSDALLQSAGLLQVWGRGFVEPAVAPPLPVHLLIQQLLALVLQEGEDGLDSVNWPTWLGEPNVFGGEVMAHAPGIMRHLLEEGWLFSDGGRLSMGPKGEQTFGRRHFLELTSAFTAEPVLSVRQGRSEIGQLPDIAIQTAFQTKPGPPSVLLAGRAWRIVNVDWKRRVVQVEPYDGVAKVRFAGGAVPLSYELCQAMAEVLEGRDPPVTLTRRAVEGLRQLRGELPGARPGRTLLEERGDGTQRWWTFAGLRANIELAARMGALRDHVTQRDNLSITVSAGVDRDTIIRAISRHAPTADVVELAQESTGGLKLLECLPPGLAEHVTLARLADPAAVEATAHAPFDTQS